MQGKDNWKWGLVFILLAIFLVTANQAYKHIASQEDFAPPDDYKKGDSWDLEHQKTQESAAQAGSSPYEEPDDADDGSEGLDQTELSNDSSEEEPLPTGEDEINWDEL
jgi:hypothetical protein